MKFFAVKHFGQRIWSIKLQEREDPTVQILGTIAFAKTPVSKWVFAPNENQLAFTKESLEAFLFFLSELSSGNKAERIDYN